MIVERIHAGLKRARKEGTKTRRPIGPPRIGADVEAKIRDDLKSGFSIRKTAELVGVNPGTVQRIRASLAKAG